jgi:AraC-like DNA-binding protein
MLDSNVLTFTDIDAYHASLRGAQVDGIVTSRGNFNVKSTKVRFDRLAIQRNEETLARVVKNSFDRRQYAMVFALRPNQQSVHINGTEVSPADLIVFGAGAEGHNRIAPNNHWGSIAVTHKTLASMGEILIGRELIAPTSTYRIRPPPALLSRMLNLHAAAGHLVETVPDILVKPEVARALEQALLEAMVACIASENAPVAHNIDHRHGAVPRRLEEFLEANLDRTVYVEELCKATGVSYPTLRGCCQDLLGMSPKRYLWLRRMHLARRALRIADPLTTNVTEIATDHGFWELGRFSVAYRSLFGEAPSTSLRHPPTPQEMAKSVGRPGGFIKSA